MWGVASGPGHSGCELGGTCRCCGVPAAPGRGAQAAGSITIRAAFLEKENTALRTEVAELRKEVGKCKTIVSKYETKYGPL